MKVLLLGASYQSSVYKSAYEYLISKGYKTIGINGHHINNDEFEFNQDPLPIIDIAKQMEVEGVLCLSTERSLKRDAMIKEDLEKKGIKVIANSLPVIEILNHKGKTREHCQQNEIPIIPGKNYVNSSELSTIGNRIGYPLVIKKPNLTGGGGVSFIGNAIDLENYRETFNNETDLVVEKFITGYEFSIEVIGIDGEYKCLEPVYKGGTDIKTHPLDKVRMVPYWESTVNNKMKEVSKRVAKSLNISGIIEVEMIWDYKTENLYLIEVNPRMGGVTNLGINYSKRNTALILTEMLTGTWNKNGTINRNRCGIELHICSDITKKMINEIKNLKTFGEIVIRNRSKSNGSVILVGEPEIILSDVEKNSSYFNNYEEAKQLLNKFDRVRK
ncbi:ATP-grasp domain-containing protein [Virgibacillus doumboii]|uniref:ATP-grasp domain-containing protein n=1 Tax=Virgibacillus doumboii TaxID=2697503 RepID=UPI0013E0AAB0|nr:ATP-grasp domain-containing protein [Virgibacillus doumboii]